MIKTRTQRNIFFLFFLFVFPIFSGNIITANAATTGITNAPLFQSNLNFELNTPDNIRIAVPWFKPNKNMTEITPDYYLHTTDDWLVFPHELDGLDEKEIFANKPGLEDIMKSYKTD